jgi:hypothetical protein
LSHKHAGPWHRRTLRVSRLRERVT